MRVKYKKIKVDVPHCGDCGEELQGENSIILPYKCSCGTWESNWQNPFEYKLQKGTGK